MLTSDGDPNETLSFAPLIQLIKETPLLCAGLLDNSIEGVSMLPDLTVVPQLLVSIPESNLETYLGSLDSVTVESVRSLLPTNLVLPVHEFNALKSLSHCPVIDQLCQQLECDENTRKVLVKRDLVDPKEMQQLLDETLQQFLTLSHENDESENNTKIMEETMAISTLEEAHESHEKQMKKKKPFRTSISSFDYSLSYFQSLLETSLDSFPEESSSFSSFLSPWFHLSPVMMRQLDSELFQRFLQRLEPFLKEGVEFVMEWFISLMEWGEWGTEERIMMIIEQLKQEKDANQSKAASFPLALLKRFCQLVPSIKKPSDHLYIVLLDFAFHWLPTQPQFILVVLRHLFELESSLVMDRIISCLNQVDAMTRYSIHFMDQTLSLTSVSVFLLTYPVAYQRILYFLFQQIKDPNRPLFSSYKLTLSHLLNDTIQAMIQGHGLFPSSPSYLLQATRLWIQWLNESNLQTSMKSWILSELGQIMQAIQPFMNQQVTEQEWNQKEAHPLNVIISYLESLRVHSLDEKMVDEAQRQWKILLPNQQDEQSSTKVKISYDEFQSIYHHFIMQQPLFQQRHSLLSHMLSFLSSREPGCRSRSLRSLSSLLQSDPLFLCHATIQDRVLLCLNDPSPMVRESVLDLIMEAIKSSANRKTVSKKEANDLISLFLELKQDSSVQIRKKWIKQCSYLFKSNLLEQDSSTLQLLLEALMQSCLDQESSSIQQLSQSVLLEWFSLITTNISSSLSSSSISKEKEFLDCSKQEQKKISCCLKLWSNLNASLREAVMKQCSLPENIMKYFIDCALSFIQNSNEIENLESFLIQTCSFYPLLFIPHYEFICQALMQQQQLQLFLTLFFTLLPHCPIRQYQSSFESIYPYLMKWMFQGKESVAKLSIDCLIQMKLLDAKKMSLKLMPLLEKRLLTEQEREELNQANGLLVQRVSRSLLLMGRMSSVMGSEMIDSVYPHFLYWAQLLHCPLSCYAIQAMGEWMTTWPILLESSVDTLKKVLTSWKDESPPILAMSVIEIFLVLFHKENNSNTANAGHDSVFLKEDQESSNPHLQIPHFIIQHYLQDLLETRHTLFTPLLMLLLDLCQSILYQGLYHPLALLSTCLCLLQWKETRDKALLLFDWFTKKYGQFLVGQGIQVLKETFEFMKSIEKKNLASADLNEKMKLLPFLNDSIWTLKTFHQALPKKRQSDCLLDWIHALDTSDQDFIYFILHILYAFQPFDENLTDALVSVRCLIPIRESHPLALKAYWLDEFLKSDKINLETFRLEWPESLTETQLTSLENGQESETEEEPEEERLSKKRKRSGKKREMPMKQEVIAEREEAIQTRLRTGTKQTRKYVSSDEDE